MDDKYIKPFKLEGKEVLVFDLETNGYLDQTDKLHCMAIKKFGEPCSVQPTLYKGEEISDGLHRLVNADILVAHNGIRFDIPALEKLYPELKEKLPPCLDTLLLTKIYNPFLQSYSLESIGKLLGEFKDDYTGGFDTYNEDMGRYNIQDVVVTDKLMRLLSSRMDFSETFIALEHEIARIQFKGERRAVGFNYEAAMKLLMQITAEMEDIAEGVEEQLGYAKVKHEQNYNLTKSGRPSINATRWVARESPEHTIVGDFCKVEYIKITLQTRKLLVERLLDVGWKPTSRTEKGYPQIAIKGEVCPNLLKLGGFEDVGKYFVLRHRHGLVDGLFKLVRKDGRIESQADTLGAVTHRYTHRGVANFPAVRTLYGEEIRELFGVAKQDSSRVFIGADLSGLELRMLAHYMNDDEYTDAILHGDIHTKNQEAAGLPSRDDAKTFVYGLFYGAGNAKIGSIVNGTSEDGAMLREKFLDSLPSLKKLIEQKQKEASVGYITSLDGRQIKMTRSQGFSGRMEYDTYKALNSLLQSSGAIFAKHWLFFTNLYLEQNNIDATVVISYHDELQIDAHKDAEEEVKKALQYGVKMSDKVLETKCPNAIEIKVGKTWRDTH